MAQDRMKRDPAIEDAVREVRAIYREWAARPIDRACTGLADCCRFRLVGHTPYLTKGEAFVAARAWKAAARKVSALRMGTSRTAA